MEKQITVLAFVDVDHYESGKGVEVENTSCQTLAEAKKCAKYYLTEEYMKTCESTVQLGYAQVKVNGYVEADFFRRGK